jgi:hypothetical protein
MVSAAFVSGIAQDESVAAPKSNGKQFVAPHGPSQGGLQPIGANLRQIAVAANRRKQERKHLKHEAREAHEEES